MSSAIFPDSLLGWKVFPDKWATKVKSGRKERGVVWGKHISIVIVISTVGYRPRRKMKNEIIFVEHNYISVSVCIVCISDFMIIILVVAPVQFVWAIRLI